MKFSEPASRVRHSRARFLTFCLILFSGSVAAEQSDVVRNLLARMSHAISNLDYQGVFVHQRGDELETIRIIHRATPEGERERLVSLNGAPREVVRKGRVVTCILPDDSSIIVDRRWSESLFPALPPSQADDLQHYYQLELLGSGRIAGLSTVVIGVEPRDAFRYGYRLWLERDTGMLLKSELLDPKGNVIEQLMFTTINLGGNVPIAALSPDFAEFEVDFGPRPPPDWQPGRPGEDFNWRAAALPPGFHLTLHQWERLADDAPPAEHLVFSDGLASVSVYVEQASEVSSPAPSGASRLGAISAYIRKLDEHRITVVGEVPSITAKTIAAGIQRRGASVAADD